MYAAIVCIDRLSASMIKPKKKLAASAWRCLLWFMDSARSCKAKFIFHREQQASGWRLEIERSVDPCSSSKLRCGDSRGKLWHFRLNGQNLRHTRRLPFMFSRLDQGGWRLLGTNPKSRTVCMTCPSRAALTDRPESGGSGDNFKSG